jgi:phage terminase large subunit
VFNCGPLFKVIYDHSFPKIDIDLLILQGGTDSGKTVAATQFLTVLARSTKPPKPNPFDLVDPLITFLNESVPNSKKGAYRTFQNVIADNQYVLDGIKDWNKTDRIIEWRSGWIMQFEGATDEQAAKQGKRMRLFVNEANGISYPVFFQYAKRTRQQTIIDYNPSAPFYAHDKFIGTTPEQNDLNAKVKLVISDHRHNPFLSKREHEKTENIRDLELWKVYARGLTGNLIGTVYTNWISIPDSKFPWNHDQLFFGLDVGWTNDPTVLMLCAKIGMDIFVHELCYEPGIAPSFIDQLMRGKGYNGVIFSEHAPDMIKQLKRLGRNVRAARKGPGSIQAGISKVKEYRVHYTESSTNLKEELKRYTWLLDEDTKLPTNEPIDAYNHALDAVRYAIYTAFYRE